MRLGKTAFLHFASQAGKSLAGFVATLVIARILGADTLGSYAVATAILFWVVVPANAVGGAVKKRISEGGRREQVLAAGLLLNAAFAIGSAILLVGLGPIIDRFVGAPIVHIIAALVFSEVAFQTLNAVLSGEKKVAKAGGVQVVERVFRTVAQIGLIMVGFGLGGLLLGYVASLLVAVLLGIRYVDVWPARPNRGDFENVFSFSSFSWLGTLKTRAFGWMDTIVLALFVPPSLIGIYEVAWNLASILVLLSISVQATLFPEISELSARNDLQEIRHLLNEGLVFTGLFAIPGLAGAIVLGPRLLSIYRPEFGKGALVLVILIVARLVAAYGDQFIQAINAVDRPDYAFRVNLAFVLTNLVLNLVLIYLYGWVGAAIATGLSAMVSAVLGHHALSSVIEGITLPVEEIILESVASLVMMGALLVMLPSVPTDNYATVGLILFGALVYIGVLLSISSRIRQKIRIMVHSGLS